MNEVRKLAEQAMSMQLIIRFRGRTSFFIPGVIVSFPSW
jgi:hypothetical protein